MCVISMWFYYKDGDLLLREVVGDFNFCELNVFSALHE